MRSRVAGAVGAAVLGAAAGGCGSSAPPIQAARPVKPAGDDKPAVLPKDPAPTAADPAAAAVVAAAVAAHTGGQPAKLDALRTAVQTRTGQLVGAGPGGPVRAAWEFRWAWPDRWRVRAQNSGAPAQVVGRAGDAGWIADDPSPPAARRPVPADMLKGVRADSVAEAMTLLLPVADPRAVAAPAADAVVRDKPAVGVRLAGPGYPNLVAHFDKETKLLARFAYEGWEAGGPVTKEVTVLSTKPFAGVTLPERVVIKWDGREFAEWTVTGVEAPAPADPALFEGPNE